jgi:hypothetical protein
VRATVARRSGLQLEPRFSRQPDFHEGEPMPMLIAANGAPNKRRFPHPRFVQNRPIFHCYRPCKPTDSGMHFGVTWSKSNQPVRQGDKPPKSISIWGLGPDFETEHLGRAPGPNRPGRARCLCRVLRLNCETCEAAVSGHPNIVSKPYSFLKQDAFP